jgi:hypothetical protein
MISLKVLGTAAAMVLILPMVAPTASFAQAFHQGRTGPGGGRPVGAAGVHGAPTARFNGGGAPTARFNGGGRFARGRGGGFIPGAVAGAVIGGAIASPSYGYGSQAYYAPGYYDDQYYDDGAVGVGPAAVGDDAVAYCIQTFRSYDPASGTYLGFDGFRHSCP